MTQLLAHLWGDYILQSDWMAQNKTKDSFAAAIHAFLYTLCFWPILHDQHFWAASVILVSHFFIDRFRLARYVVWAKNWLGPNKPWSECDKTGYSNDAPPWLAFWLLIIADNTLHLTINFLAIRYL